MATSDFYDYESFRDSLFAAAERANLVAQIGEESLDLHERRTFCSITLWLPDEPDPAIVSATAAFEWSPANDVWLQLKESPERDRPWTDNLDPGVEVEFTCRLHVHNTALERQPTATTATLRTRSLINSVIQGEGSVRCVVEMFENETVVSEIETFHYWDVSFLEELDSSALEEMFREAAEILGGMRQISEELA